MNQLSRVIAVLAAGALLLWRPASTLGQQKLSPQLVRQKIRKAHLWLKVRQNGDGSFTPTRVAQTHKVGLTSMALLAMMNSGLKPTDPNVKKGLRYLRNLRSLPTQTYDASLMLMALCAANDGTDADKKARLVAILENGQKKTGRSAGGWTYSSARGLGNPDGSNTQFAVLALRDAAVAGVTVKKSTWQLIQKYWEFGQTIKGGWGYSQGSTRGRGSMTVAGVASLSIAQRMLEERKGLNCCEKTKPYPELEKGIRWLEQRAPRGIASNPGSGTNVLYWMYGLERAGRLTGRRFFGKSNGKGFDWYREGVDYLVLGRGAQHREGYWVGRGHGETDRVVATSMALLFLSKGLAPVLVNKLKYGAPKPRDPDEVKTDNWNRHRNDTRNITEYISARKDWPKLLTWQTVEMRKMVRNSRSIDEAVVSLEQAKVLLIAGADAPSSLFEDKLQHTILRRFVDRGGFILFAENCRHKENDGFDKGVKTLIKKMFSDKNGKQIASLKRLPKEHPIYRAEVNLRESHPDLPFYGVQYGCRTAVVYVPVRKDGWDMTCLWDKWTRHGGAKLSRKHSTWMTLALDAGTNILAYATGREPPQKLEERDPKKRGKAGDIQRGLLQVAKLKHTGDWDVAPRALRNLLIAMNEWNGLTAAEKHRTIPPTSKDVFRHPVVYMHGRNQFKMSATGINQLRTYLKDRGGLLFADACCGSKEFDTGFRKFVGELFPKAQFKQIPVTHELFTTKIGFNLNAKDDKYAIKRRIPEAENADAKLVTVIKKGPPILEGIEIDGRLVVIYSKYDISCALERQASISCSGYLETSAMRIGINILSYALLQDVRYSKYFD